MISNESTNLPSNKPASPGHRRHQRVSWVSESSPSDVGSSSAHPGEASPRTDVTDIYTWSKDPDDKRGLLSFLYDSNLGEFVNGVEIEEEEEVVLDKTESFCTTESPMSIDKMSHMKNLACRFNSVAHSRRNATRKNDRSRKDARYKKMPRSLSSISMPELPLQVDEDKRFHRRFSSLGETSTSGGSWASWREKSSFQEKAMLKLAVKVEDLKIRLSEQASRYESKIEGMEKANTELRASFKKCDKCKSSSENNEVCDSERIIQLEEMLKKAEEQTLLLTEYNATLIAATEKMQRQTNELINSGSMMDQSSQRIECKGRNEDVEKKLSQISQYVEEHAETTENVKTKLFLNSLRISSGRCKSYP